MELRTVRISEELEVGGGKGLFLIAGPCAAESFELCRDVARQVSEICGRLGIPYIFKSSYDKANRSSVSSYRGPGLDAGLDILCRVKESAGVAVLTDVHTAPEIESVKAVADVLQIPAFLCRQTDLIVEAASTGKALNIKKGQFLAPWDMHLSAEKAASTGNENILLTERGTSFGYNQLVVDMRSIPMMRETGYPVIFDGTHSVQEPGGLGSSTGGRRDMIPHLARAACAAGADGFFFEVHPRPDEALCDGPNTLALADLEPLLKELQAIHVAARTQNPT
ncbi:MAG: 3-deoxy-8-phosphooctulonate synthase [Planctomycetota bacterium]|jgi:2-dehydro-3-deoxyphosphooctonate aldolase (KDO 8-P synthase)